MNKTSLQDFLLSHSKIDKDFILDFFDIRNNYHVKDNYPFIINLEVVSSWLKANKIELKRTLISSYKENTDYKLAMGMPIARLKHGGNNKMNVYLTVDCFKMLCMRSHSAKAEEVRKYYIQIEDLIDEYKEFIIESQTKEIEKLEYELVKEKYPEGSHFYIYEINNLYKIGATDNLKLRFKNINSSHPYSIKPVLTIETDHPYKIEKCVQSILMNDKIKRKKDFYKTNMMKILNATQDCEKIINKYSCIKCNKDVTKNKIINHIKKYHTNKTKIYKIKAK
jgi:phage anti-repressor protein